LRENAAVGAMGDRRVIYVTGYPKSGTVWLTRLLADALNCPALPQSDEDVKDWVTEGLDRPAPFEVRHDHFVLTRIGDCPVVPALGYLAWKMLTDEIVVLIIRDPRDIVVSDAHHFNRPLDESLDAILNGSSAHPPWIVHIGEWQNARFDYDCVRYEDLLVDPEGVVSRLFAHHELPFEQCRLRAVVQRQSFAERKRWTELHGDMLPRGREFQLRQLRKGIAGDWHNHFKRAHGRYMEKHLGELMREQGYTQSSDWWEDLPE